MPKYQQADQIPMRVQSPEGMGLDRELFEGKHEPARAELLPMQSEWWTEAQKVREELRQKAKAGTLTDREAQESRYRVAEDYHLKQQAAREEVDAEFAKAEAEWRKGRDPTTELLALSRARNRYDSMTPEEIGAAAMEYAKKPQGWHPDQVEALLVAAVRVKSPQVTGMRDIMRKTDYQRPWTHDKPELRNLRKLLDAPFGIARVLSPMYGPTDAEIKKLFD